MRNFRTPAALVGAGLLVSAAIVLPASGASACQTGLVAGDQTVASPAGTLSGPCCVADTYTITASSTVRIPFSGVPTFKDGPGGTLQVSKSYSGTAKASVTAGASAEIGGVLAKAKVSVDATLETSTTTTATNTYTHIVTSGKFGNAQYVSYGKAVSYKKSHTNADCTGTTSTGKINYPSSTEGWYYWETSS